MDARYFFLVFLIPLIGITRSENEIENVEDSGAGESELRAWPWGRRNKFVCPSLFGTFADIFDCSSFYICVGGISNRKTCNRRMQFDKYKKVCLPFIIAVCDKGDGDDTTKSPTTKDDGDVTTKDKFSCPSMIGKYPYPDDCSKYYSCALYISTVKSCPKSELFDEDKKQCRPAKDVDCGKRERPTGDDDDDDDTTTSPTTKDDGEVTTKDKIFCLTVMGKYPYPDDCSKYYSCALYISTVKSCPKSELFDEDKKQCRPAKDVDCGKRKRPTDDDDDATVSPTTKNDEEIATKGKFTCPSIIGLFLHPDDCSKYYSCTFYIPTLKSCPDSELFDGIKKQCRPAKDVHCGSRERPTDATTEEITTTQIPTETPTPTEPEIPTPTETETTTPTETPTTTTTAEPTTTTTTEPTTTTTAEPTTTTTEPTTTTTTEEPTTTPKPKVTAPDTDCDEDDVDCIIDDLGETPDWFVCTEDLGSYPHPSSKKLFIFCLNWKPFVKKCGQDLVFSEELMTCTHP